MNGWRRWLRSVLGPVGPVYGAVVGAKRGMYKSGWLKQRRLGSPVISVGSVSAGGAGKTPMVLEMAAMLKRGGYAVRILTRGYGRRSGKVERVEVEMGGGAARRYGDERVLLAQQYGDEPVLLAQHTGVPVYVGADRYQAGRMAEEDAEGRMVVHLLDDGFQHGRLARDLDVVLLTRKDVEDDLLPAGDLREPLSALREADVIVLREEEVEGLSEFLAGLMGETGPPAVWVIRRRLRFGAERSAPMPERPLAFCGIARPEGFFEMLEAEGYKLSARVEFADHHRYGDRDVTRLIEAARGAGADGFLTTEKDGVKLSRGMRGRLEAVGPVVIPELRVELLDEKGAMEQIVGKVDRLDRRRRVR